MYHLSVPLMSSTVNESNREQYAAMCKEAGVSRVFLCSGSIVKPIPQQLYENVAYFKSQGFEVGLWTDTIGHGVVLNHVQDGGDGPVFPLMVDLAGEERPYANCPLDEGFRSHIAGRIQKLAETGTDIVMLDDDFRMSQHGGELCCACPSHLRRIGEILGETVTIEQLRPFVKEGKGNRYRDAWLQAQNEGLTLLARDIREAVDAVAPHVRVCFCTAYSPWNVDGADVVGLTKLLAGNNPPLLRLTGAPYWAVKARKYSLIGVMEIARMLAFFMRGENIELMSEGDVYPRPRYTCPASYLELYDLATRADGHYDGILKYMFDYVAGPEMETGYLKFHHQNTPFYGDIATLFPKGANAGVHVVARPHTMKHADFSLSPVSEHSPRPVAGFMLGACSIPTIYHGKGTAHAVFGENARLLDLSLLADGCILDAVSARILTERGVDVGLGEVKGMKEQTISFLCTEDESYKSFISDGHVRVLDAALAEKAAPVLFSTNPVGKEIFAYRYENENGERFLVLLFDGDSIYSPTRVGISGLLENPPLQRVLTREIPWLARKPLPVYSTENPSLYLMCEETEDSLSVLMLNCFADQLMHPVLELGDTYRAVECYGCNATLEGQRVVLQSPMYGYTAAAFRLFK